MSPRYAVLIALFTVPLCLAGPTTNEAKPRIDNLPMYGQPEVTRPDWLKKADQDFIKKAAKGFSGDLRATCIAWCEAGDVFLEKGDLDKAMRRYNQGWLLNPESYLPYWGFARVALQKDNFAEATKYFERSIALCDDERQRPALLSDAGSAYSYLAAQPTANHPTSKAESFSKANTCFEKSTALAPDYGNAWKRWSMSLYREGCFAEAWVKLHQARKTGATDIPASYVQALTQAMPETR